MNSQPEIFIIIITMKWYEQNYINRRDWVLDHLELLGLDGNETMIVLLIDFMNEHRIPVSLDSLHKKTGLNEEEINRIISSLCARKYLEIRGSAKSVRFLLNGLYETDIARDQRILDKSLFDVFETEFGRPLSNRELEKLSDWNKVTDKKLILYALREASAYQALNMNYIDKILKDWKDSGLTAQMIEEGKR